MRKLIKGTLGVILLCIIGGAIFLFVLWSRLPDMIASNLSKRLQVGVEIGDMSLSPSSIGVEKFVIHNLPRYKLPKAFSAETIDIEAPLTRYVKNDIVIDQILVSDVYIGLEFESIKSAKGNWSTILANAQSAKEESSKTASEKTVLIKRLLLTNIQVDLYYQSEGKIKKLKTIPQIELTNISSQGGNVGDQIMNSALGQAVKEVFIQENLKNIFDQLLQSPATPFKEYLGPLKNFLNTVSPEVQESTLY
jgi:hypothetical protein